MGAFSSLICYKQLILMAFHSVILPGVFYYVSLDLWARYGRLIGLHWYCHRRWQYASSMRDFSVIAPSVGLCHTNKFKKYVQLSIRPPVRLRVRPQLLSTAHDRRHTKGVINCCKQSATVAPVVNSHRPLCFALDLLNFSLMRGCIKACRGL